MKQVYKMVLAAGIVALVAMGCSKKDEKGEAMSKEIVKQENPVVKIVTNKGEITLELARDKAPLSVENFLSYVREGQYNHTIFHRVIDGFMIQGGGFTADMDQKPTKAPVKNEASNGLKNKRGTVAMARTSDVDSATSQFFINVADNDFLDHKGDNPRVYGYAVFGSVTQGMDVIDQIKEVETGKRGMHQNVPIEDIEIVEVKVIKE